MDWLRDAATAFAILASAFAIYRSLRLTPHEEGASDASAAKSYAEAAELAEGWSRRLSERLTKCEEKVEGLATEGERLGRENKEYLTTLTNWAVGIMLLLAQVRANQLTAAWFPVQETLDKFIEIGKEIKK